MNRRLLCLIALLLTAALLMWRLPAPNGSILPGTSPPQRTVLSLWTLSSIGGGQAWLKQALKRYERTHPGVVTYLRQCTQADMAEADAVLPDVLLYMPGDIAALPQLTPISLPLPVAQPLLVCGQHDAQQLGLPLCWGAYVLAINSRMEPGSAVTPAPTTLLGRPAPTAAATGPTAAPEYPLQAASQEKEPLQCAAGIPQLVLRMLLQELPALPQTPLPQSQVYARYLSGSCGSAVLTTGQATALEQAVLNGKAPASRIMTPASIVTDQVWLASLCKGADAAAAGLLAWLISAEAQQLLAAQQLQPAREGLWLYDAGIPAEISAAALRGLTAVNAYLPRTQTEQLSHQALQGCITPAEAIDRLR